MPGIYVPGKGNSSPNIVLLGEAPSFKEEELLEPFVGPSGKFLDQILNDVGIARSDVWVSNVCKYYVPPMEKIPFKVRAAQIGINLEEQIQHLQKELYSLQPNIVVCLGGTALWAMTGKTKIKNFRGSLLSGAGGFKVLGTYHPAHILHQEGEVKGYWNKQILAFDLKRALKHSYTKQLELPVRNLNICKNSGQLYDFIARKKASNRLAIDIEAYHCLPACIGLAFDKFEGLTVPLWNTHNISTIPNSDMVSIWSLLSNLLNDSSVLKIGQNFNYDRDKLQRLGFVIDDLYDDTMIKAFAINPELPKNLAFLTSLYTEEPFYKDEGMYEGSIGDLLLGCARDACVTWEVADAQQKDIEEIGTEDFYREFLLPCYDLYRAIEQVGFKTDEVIRAELLTKYIERDEKLRYLLFQLTGEYINSNSPPQVKALLDKWGYSSLSGTGEEAITQILNNHANKSPLRKAGLEAILEDRRVKLAINTYLYSPPDYDGRMRTSYFICLETGRSSTSQQDPPIRPSVDIKKDGKKAKQARGMAFQTITKHGDIGADVRKMFVPDDGEIFLQADSSQAEARVIFILAEDYEALELIDKHDYHALTASWFFGGTESDYSKKTLGYESPIRFAGKTLRHAGHLGAGKRRASIELNTQARKYKIDFTISEAKAGAALDIFHKRQPKIRSIFHAGVQGCLARDRRLSSPVPYGVSAAKGGIRTFYERWNEDLFRQAYSYIPQRTVSESTKGAALRISARATWIRIIVEAHDALLVSVPIERKYEAAGILREEFSRPIDFSTCSLPRGQLIIPCDIEEGMNYMELSKFKWVVPDAIGA